MQYLRGKNKGYEWDVDANGGTQLLLFSTLHLNVWTDFVHVQPVVGD